jgi:hypothetical protein
LIVLTTLLLALPTAFLLRTFLGGWQTVMSVDALERAEVAYIRNAGIFLVQTEDGPLALTAASPHPDHGLHYCRASETFVGTHGEVFDRRGFYLGGPAPRGMDRVAVRTEGGVVQVDADEVTPGPPRGAGSSVEPTRLQCDLPDADDPAGFAPATG